MSKKKKKINKKLIQERLRNLQSGDKKRQEEAQKTEQKEVEKKNKTKEIKREDDYIFSDMKKIFYVSLAILVIFIVLIILNFQTDYLNEGGIWLFRILSVGQL